jgi:N-acyl-D-aspartate/D-glutamate deacylase
MFGKGLRQSPEAGDDDRQRWPADRFSRAQTDLRDFRPGAEPHVWGLGALRLEYSIRKVSATPAARIGQSERGLFRQGLKADLFLFDPATIAERATWEQPRLPAQGVSQVVINGHLVLDDEIQTGALAGRALRHTD